MVNQSVCMGLRNKEVAELLSISEKTVKLHLNRIFKKLSISSRGELMALDRNFLRLSYDCSSEQPVY
jgi:DNA-binding NarL/FixJ family response regulator